MNDLERLLQGHPFVEGMDPDHVRLLVACTRNLRFRSGEYLMRAGEHEDALYLIRQGSVGIELARPGAETLVLETVGPGDIVGVSLFTSMPAHLDCRARETVLAVALDNRCLLHNMETDPRLGYALTKRLLVHTYERLSRARLQHIDVYR